MKASTLIIGLGLIGTFVSCSSTKVITDMNKATDFNKYTTYQLKFHQDDTSKSIILNELNQKRIVNALEAQLTSSGMQSASENPDAYIVYGVGIDVIKGYTTSANYMGSPHFYGYGRRGGFYGGFGSSHSSTTETQTTNGTLVVALIDAETDELLWISRGTRELRSNTKKIEENINKSVAKIFEQFPVQHQIEQGNDPELLSRNR